MTLLQEICRTKRYLCLPTSKNCLFLSLLLIILTFHCVRFQDVPSTISKICNLQKTCSSCIRIAPECAWCKAEKSQMFSSEFRCDLLSDQLIDCPQGDIVNPKPNVHFVHPEPLSNPGDSVESMVQLTPQKVVLKIRPNSPQQFEIQFRQTMDYPVDLYYLMDVSESMRDDKEKLANLGTQLGSTMRNLTRNFQIGYGSFVDKKQMPYADMRPETLKNPCSIVQSTCVASYGFKNNMGLNEDFNKFADEVRNTNISANLDNPEGSLDALLQAIVCKNEIGWRNQSRKIILLATDSEFHAAGDGKLGGIVLPNDGLCHLDSNGEYTETTTQDYPSISQIVTTARDNDVSVIFAANSDSIGIYNRLKDFIPGSTIAELASDSSNIVDLIEKQYQEITAAVEFTHDSNEFISVNYFTNCSSSQGEFLNRNRCRDIKMGDTVHFEVEINMNSCPANPLDRKQTLHIWPVGLGEKLTLDLELLCDCDCENATFEVVNSPKCSEIGTYECGICNCLGTKLGDFCECDGNTTVNFVQQSNCRRDNSPVVCSGRGVCECGKCSCFAGLGRVYGDFCECDDISCPYYDGKLCGGSSNGRCICGSCQCNAHFNGEDCGCKNSTVDCISENDKLCSDIGECVCGRCQCPLQYGGALCQEYLNLEGICNKSSQCLTCNASRAAGESQFNCENCVIHMVDDLGDLQENDRQCMYIDEDKCRVFFHILTNSSDMLTTTVHLRVSKDRQCAAQANLNIIIPIIVAIVLGIGLLAIACWKVITMIHDNREYARFDKNLKEAKWDRADNPVYVEAVTKYLNPTYRQEKS